LYSLSAPACLPFTTLLTQNLSPSDIAGSDITSWKLYDAWVYSPLMVQVSICKLLVPIIPDGTQVASHHCFLSTVSTWFELETELRLCGVGVFLNYLTFLSSRTCQWAVSKQM